VESTVETLIQLIKQNPRITQSKLMNKLTLSRRGVEWHIKKIKEKGILTRKGSTLEDANIGKLFFNSKNCFRLFIFVFVFSNSCNSF
jgi:ATP-dependent DNA helicase RecG